MNNCEEKNPTASSTPTPVVQDIRCYTIEDLMAMLILSRPTVCRLLKQNEFRWFKVGGAYGKVLLYVPHDKWVKRLFSYNALKIKYDKQNGNKEVWEPVRRTRLLHLDDLEILNQYNAEIRGLYNYYRLANNVSVLNNFYYVMRYSMLKTFAGKYRTRISRIIRKYRQGKDFVVEYPKKNGKVGKVLFYNNGFRRDTKVESGNPDIVARIFENYGRNSLIKRLQANRCEWCGAENVPLEIHHIRKLKDLSGRKQWEIAMIGRKRKTMALCIDCHDKLHAGKLD